MKNVCLKCCLLIAVFAVAGQEQTLFQPDLCIGLNTSPQTFTRFEVEFILEKSPVSITRFPTC